MDVQKEIAEVTTVHSGLMHRRDAGDGHPERQRHDGTGTTGTLIQ